MQKVSAFSVIATASKAKREAIQYYQLVADGLLRRL
jgi:hypothetical protein